MYLALEMEVSFKPQVFRNDLTQPSTNKNEYLNFI